MEIIKLKQLRELLEITYHDNPTKCYAAGQQDLRCEEYSFTIDDFIRMLEQDSTFKILY